ncbi:TPA: hypothetical protein ACH3X3_006019 [Trebouxia sp. C0006]
MHNDQRSAGLVLQSMSVHGNNYHSSPQLPPGLLPAHPNSSLVASPARQRGRNRPSSGSSKKHCNCKNSRCLKLYCECFASGRYCDGCNCVNCCNNMENESTRQSAVEAILERNPNAFRPKIQAGASEEGTVAGTARHNKGCNCKKSGCLKKYCECFQAGIYCGDNCKCIDCKNFEGSEAREAVALTAFQPQDMASRHHQPLPHHSPAQNKRQRLAPPHSLHSRQQHPPLPAIPVNNRQPLPAIPEMVSRSMHHGHRSRMHHSQAPGDPSTRGGVQPGYQLTGPLGTALSMGTSASQQQPGGFFKETVHEMFRRGGVDDICALLVSVAHEQQEPSSPSGPSGPQATRAALLPSLTAPGQMQDGSLQATGLDTVAGEQLSGTGGVSKLYESQERAVLHEYHDVLLKLVDRASQKQKDAQQPSISRPSREAPASSRPLSAPANMTDAPQQHMNGGANQGHTSSMLFDQLSQTRLMQQPHQQQQQQQPHQQLLAAASQPPAGASYLPAPSSSSYLAGGRFGGNGMGGIHLPLGVSHLDPDGYLTNPSQPGLGAPVQTGMGNPGQAGSGGAQQLGLGNPVQTGMGDGLKPSQPAGLYQRPSSAQPLGNRQSMQADARNRQGSHMGGVSNPLGPNHQAPLSNAPAEEGLRQSAQMQSMQLPVGSMITNPPIQPLTHHSSQLQSQPHFQQPLPNPRMYQSFTDALTESSQPLSAPSMHSMPPHGLNHDLYSQSQGSAMAFQGYSSQPQAGQGMLMQPHAGQGTSAQPRMGQGMSMQSGQTDGGMNVHSSGGSLLANGMSFGQSLPDGSAQMSSHM